MQEHEVKVNPEPAILGLLSIFSQSLATGPGYTDRGNGGVCKWWAPVASVLLGSLQKIFHPPIVLKVPTESSSILKLSLSMLYWRAASNSAADMTPCSLPGTSLIPSWRRCLTSR